MMSLWVTGVTILLNLTIEPWRAINDNVMGGISSGEMVEIDEGLRFQGQLSLENNGGFASVRRLVDADLSQATGIRLSIRGDDRRYQMRLRQDRQFDGVAWSLAFDAKSAWQLVELQFSDFKPVFRGRDVPSAGPVIPGEIAQIGFLLADKKPGRFYLDIRLIEFITADPH